MDKKSYIIAKNSANAYTNDVLDGVTLINGANCTIDAITPSADGKYTIVTFGWTGTSTGEHYTKDMRVDNGEDGLGIKKADIDEHGHLIITYDDDTEEDAGPLPVKTVEVGDVETVDYDEGAAVEAEDTETGIKLNFKIPRGQEGTADPVWNII